MKKNSSRLPGLDGVRGLAICAVVIHHYFGVGLHFPPGSTAAYAQKLLGLSWAGVDLFFVLSGFLIGGILMDHRDAKNYFTVFYLRRSARILPPYVLLLAGWLLVGSTNVLTGGNLAVVDGRLPAALDVPVVCPEHLDGIGWRPWGELVGCHLVLGD